MRLRTPMILAAMPLALWMLSACGNKNKKETTTPIADNSAEVDKEPETSTGDQSQGGQAGSATDPSAAANLQNVVYFAFDSTDLDDVAREKLNENATWLKADSARTLTIEGHTDEAGTTEYNLGLGHRRAQAAKDYLVRLGVEESRVRIISYGEERPASTEDSQNRRSMFIANKKK